MSALAYDVRLGNVTYNGSSYRPTNLYGQANFKLIPTHNPLYHTNYDTDVTSLSVQYRHNRNPFFGSVGFTVSGVTISFDLSDLTDSAATSTNVEYSTTKS